MKKYIIIKADTNDADYVQSKDKITDEQLEKIKPVIKAIKDFKSYEVKNVGYDKKSTWTHDNNYPTGDCIREDLGQLSAEDYYIKKGIPAEQFYLFDGFVPSSEHGIHTIESVEILTVLGEEKLL